MPILDKNPWQNFDSFNPEMFSEQSSELVQWPIKLWKAPILSPYYHRAHLLIAADCSAFSYPRFHDAYSRGKVTLICCMNTDIEILIKLKQIFRLNSISSVTVVKTDRDCCRILPAFGSSRQSSLPCFPGIRIRCGFKQGIRC